MLEDQVQSSPLAGVSYCWRKNEVSSHRSLTASHRQRRTSWRQNQCHLSRYSYLAELRLLVSFCSVVHKVHFMCALTSLLPFFDAEEESPNHLLSVIRSGATLHCPIADYFMAVMLLLHRCRRCSRGRSHLHASLTTLMPDRPPPLQAS